jgi:hypothetical protein
MRVAPGKLPRSDFAYTALMLVLSHAATSSAVSNSGSFPHAAASSEH